TQLFSFAVKIYISQITESLNGIQVVLSHLEFDVLNEHFLDFELNDLAGISVVFEVLDSQALNVRLPWRSCSETLFFSPPVVPITIIHDRLYLIEKLNVFHRLVSLCQ